MKMFRSSYFALLVFFLLGTGTSFAQRNSLYEKRGVVVNPVERSQVDMLVDAGIIETEGYSDLVLNMGGMPSSAPQKAGVVGAILIPDIAPFDEAFRQWGILPAVIELTVEVKPNATSFIAKQKRFDIGFPRYKLLFYNTTDSTMKIAFFAYRTTQ